MTARFLIILVQLAALLTSADSTPGATAKCVVVEKKGNLMMIDCGDRAKGFPEKGKVKIKTDRDKR